MSKILFISPLPTHPHDEGPRANSFNLLMNLIEAKNEVHFLYIRGVHKLPDESEMLNYWGSRLHATTYHLPKRNFAKRVLGFFKRLFRVNLYFLDNWYYSIDDWYDDSINSAISPLVRKQKFDCVIVDYVMFSKALEQFDNSVQKIINTHEAFTNRHRVFRPKYGYNWYTATATEEARGLNRAAIILAVHEDDAKFFRQITNRKVVNAGFLFDPPKTAPKDKPGNKILFIGCDNKNNFLGIQHFVNDILPLIKKRLPAAELIVAGRICNLLADFQDCIRLGVVENIADAYQQADVVINPVYLGTGLSIKCVEALCYSKPLVTTTLCAHGLENGEPKAFLVADTEDEFAECVVKILENAEFRNSLSVNAYRFAKKYYEARQRELTRVFTTEPQKSNELSSK